MMKRDECLKVLARHRKDEVVAAVWKAAHEWIHISPGDLNYTFVGAMGQGASHALGLALARPDKRIIVLDGDGSLLMNLGCLVTIANVAPRNFIHCLCENGIYETNGGVAIPGAGRVSFSGLARWSRAKITLRTSGASTASSTGRPSAAPSRTPDLPGEGSGGRCFKIMVVVRLGDRADALDDLLPALAFVGAVKDLSVGGAG
ncbi:MAG: hypothetical protein HYY47_03190, partial [Deltaproteobacteria bacterium]|nr:hypothetical protein [Deltaproteobacteria bacterium]